MTVVTRLRHLALVPTVAAAAADSAPLLSRRFIPATPMGGLPLPRVAHPRHQPPGEQVDVGLWSGGQQAQG